MELYILSKQDLSILSICKVADYQINLDEETNAKSTITLMKTDGLKEGNFLVLNGLYRQFLFVIPSGGISTEKGSDMVTVTALDISNIFDRKVIEKNTDTMTAKSIEEFIANTMSENFVNSDDTALNVGYIDIYWKTNTQAVVSTNAENGLYNFHTFLINCRQYKNIYTDFKFEDGRLKITIENKQEKTEMIDTTLPEVVDYNKVYEEDVTAKVTVLIREDGSEYNLYLKTDRTTTTNKDDPDRASGKIEVISVDTADMAPEEALNVMKGNNYKHLVEFKIAKTSKLMDITQLHIGRPILIKTDDDIYESYISAITLNDENFVYFKSGSLRITLLDKLKKTNSSGGNKLDVTGGKILGNLDVNGDIYDKFGTAINNGLADYGDGNIDANTTLSFLCLSKINTPNTGYYFVLTMFFGDKTALNKRSQIAIPYMWYITENKGKEIYIRQYADGEWNDWTLVNDKRLTSGTEYATNEFIDGKRVYEQNFVFTTTIPASSGTSVFTIDHGITGYNRIWIDMSNSYFINTNGRSYPVVQTHYQDLTSNETVQAYLDEGKICVATDGGWGTSWTKVFRLKYTKT